MTQARVAIDERIAKVLKRDACSGCGACALLDSGLTMALDAAGYARPARTGPSTARADAGHTFDKVCPGVQVRAPRLPQQRVHPIFGPYIEVWRAWAADPEVRDAGSSGGTLTALNIWLLDTGQAHRVTGAAAGPNPRRTVPVTIMSRDAALRAAGSRYAPVGAASNPDVQTAGTVAVGKPCEVSALRALASTDEARPDSLLLSFFCAGTPSSLATDALIDKLGFDTDVVPDALWYRGHGWPGEFTVRVGNESRSTSYNDSWGKTLGPTTQWRCKVCVDGTGEAADIVAADSWRSDENGYPVFDEESGMSALIARTPRGQAIIRAAIEAGALVAEPFALEELESVQPLQVDRRVYLLPRMIGSLLAGRKAPRYPGYLGTLVKSMLRHPRLSLRVARGTLRRVRTQDRS